MFSSIIVLSVNPIFSQNLTTNLIHTSPDYHFQLITEPKQHTDNLICMNRKDEYFTFMNTANPIENESIYLKQCQTSPNYEDFKDKKVVVFDPISLSALEGEFEGETKVFFSYYYIDAHVCFLL